MTRIPENIGAHTTAGSDGISLSDTRWKAALRGDDETTASVAFTEIYNRHRQRMIQYGQRTCRLQADEAADVSEDVFARFWHRRRSLHIADTVERYLLRAVANGARDHSRTISRRESRERQATMDSESMTEDDTALDTRRGDLVAQITALLTTLTRRQQLVVTMRLIDRKTISAIAAEIRISENTVRADLRRAVHQLSSELRRGAHSASVRTQR
jgi:RNA polymerase sigma factor (sigma-70 family)